MLYTCLTGGLGFEPSAITAKILTGKSAPIQDKSRLTCRTNSGMRSRKKCNVAADLALLLTIGKMMLQPWSQPHC